jgi:hypothetical protein
MKGDKRASGQKPASSGGSPGVSLGASPDGPTGASPPPSHESSPGASSRASPSSSALPSFGPSLPNRILGSLRDALNAASREDRSGEISLGQRRGIAPGADSPKPATGPAAAIPKPAADARDVRPATRDERHLEVGEPTKEVRRVGERAPVAPAAEGPAKTQALRGKAKVVHSAFHQDPVVGWLVIVGGAGLGAFRPIYEGNNSIGRSKNQRIPIDFGDDTISAEEQAYIRYDSMDRSFLFVPNLSKTNIVAVNDQKPTGAVKLAVMDVITMGRTQLAFVPFCGEDFDWSELSDLKE